ncbi:MAG TPA: hypothetical protein V6C85_08000 [Allocoleopsis sp.]
MRQRSLIAGRFRRRVDAEGHLRILKQLMPTVPFAIAFDVPPEHTGAILPPKSPNSGGREKIWFPPKLGG